MITRRRLLTGVAATGLLLPVRRPRAFLLQGAVAACTTSSFTGVGDVVTLTAYWGVRAYKQSYAASCGNAFDLVRASDSATMTAAFLTTGALDITTLTTWIGASSALISKAYDQTGNGWHVSRSVGSRPTLSLTAGPGSTPCILSNSGADVGLNGSSFTPSTGVDSITIVANRISGTTGSVMCGIQGTGSQRLQAATSANQWRMRSGASSSFTPTANDNTWHGGQLVFQNGASASVARIDSTETTGTMTVGTTSNTVQFAHGASTEEIRYCEGGFIDGTAWDSTQRGDIWTNQQAWYAL